MKSRFALFLFSVLFQMGWAHPDTVTVTDISAKPDVVSGYIHGTEITVTFKKKFPVRKNESSFQSYHFAVHVLDETGKPVSSANSFSRYDQNGRVVSENSTTDADILQSGIGKFFIPYYVLKMNEGSHKLKVRLEVMRLDSAKGKFDSKKVVVLGPVEKMFSINKPRTRTVKLCCTGVRVKGHNSKGNSWDFGSSGLPDLVYRVLLEGAEVSDRMYSSPEVQNATSAAWLDYTSHITISEGDRISIGIYDNDTMYDDLIGIENLSMDELLAAASTAKELHFGYVDYCTLKATEIKTTP